MESVFKFHPTARTLLAFSEVTFGILMTVLLLRLIHSFMTLMWDRTPTKTRYHLSQFRFMLTISLDCFLLNKFCTFGCFEFVKYKVYGHASCPVRFHLPIEAFLEGMGFIALMAALTFTAVILVAKCTCLKTT